MIKPDWKKWESAIITTVILCGGSYVGGVFLGYGLHNAGVLVVIWGA